MKKFLSKFSFILMLIAIVAVLAVFRLTVPMYTIASGSMEPTLPVGSQVILQPATSLQPGDIITFQQAGEDQPVTHTFIGYDKDGSLMTKGDANPTPDVYDTPLTIDDVKGKLWMVSMLFVPSFWLSTKGLAVILIAAVGIFLLATREKKNKQEELQQDKAHEEIREPSPV